MKEKKKNKRKKEAEEKKRQDGERDQDFIENFPFSKQSTFTILEL